MYSVLVTMLQVLIRSSLSRRFSSVLPIEPFDAH